MKCFFLNINKFFDHFLHISVNIKVFPFAFIMGIILHLTNFKNRTKQKKMKCENYLFQLGLVVRGRPQPKSPQFMSSDRYSRSTSLHRIRTSGWIKIDFSTIFSGITIAATSLALESFSMIRSWLKCWTQLEYICCMFVWKGKIAWNDKKITMRMGQQ